MPYVMLGGRVAGTQSRCADDRGPGERRMARRGRPLTSVRAPVWTRGGELRLQVPIARQRSRNRARMADCCLEGLAYLTAQPSAGAGGGGVPKRLTTPLKQAKNRPGGFCFADSAPDTNGGGVDAIRP